LTIKKFLEIFDEDLVVFLSKSIISKEIFVWQVNTMIN